MVWPAGWNKLRAEGSVARQSQHGSSAILQQERVTKAVALPLCV